jgi:hypothetical protein
MLFAALGVTLTASSALAAQTPRPLTPQEMREIRAGLNVTFFSTPITNLQFTTDNPVIDFTFTSAFPSSNLFVETRAGNVKIAFTNVATNASGGGRFRARAFAPLNTSFNPRVFFCNPGATSCGNAATGGVANNVRLDTRVQVNNVRFHNLSAPGAATSFPIFAAGRLVDELNLARGLTTTPSIDRFFEQCTTANRIQLRGVQFDTIALSTAGCTVFDDDQTIMSPAVGCPGVKTPTDVARLFDFLASVISVEDFHIFWVDSLNGAGGSTRGVHFGGGRNWALVQDNLDTNANVDPRGTAVTVAHEYLHARGLCHPDQAGCTQPGNTCAFAPGPDFSANANRNVMCSSASSPAGSALVAGQCTTASTTAISSVVDRN